MDSLILDIDRPQGDALGAPRAGGAGQGPAPVRTPAASATEQATALRGSTAADAAAPALLTGALAALTAALEATRPLLRALADASDDVADGTPQRLAALLPMLHTVQRRLRAAGSAHEAGQPRQAGAWCCGAATACEDAARLLAAVRGGCVAAPPAWRATEAVIDRVVEAGQLARTAGDAWAREEVARA